MLSCGQPSLAKDRRGLAQRRRPSYSAATGHPEALRCQDLKKVDANDPSGQPPCTQRSSPQNQTACHDGEILNCHGAKIKEVHGRASLFLPPCKASKTAVDLRECTIVFEKKSNEFDIISSPDKGDIRQAPERTTTHLRWVQERARARVAFRFAYALA